MTGERTCPQCGTPLGRDAAEGFCPNCTLEGALLLGSHVPPPNPQPAFSHLLPSDGRRAGGEGTRFGDYELLEEIARGGMGVVYKARQVSLDRIVAVKLILFGQFADEAAARRLRAEAQAAARLQHPNIVAIHEVGDHAGQPFFSMDYVEGQNLADFARDHPLTTRHAAQLLKTIAEAIHYAHQQGIVHRDLKPSNILIDAAFEPHITDFGLAKQLPLKSEIRNQKSEIDLTLSGQVLGSPSYIPPEQASGKRGAIGPHSDIYSLGAILYHLLTGRPPFCAETITATLRLVAESDPISPRLLNPSVPRDLETICLKCLEKEPAKRYPTPQALAEDLNRFLRNEPIRTRPVSQPEKLWRWARRKPAFQATSFVAVALLLAVAIGSPIAVFRINQARRVVEQNLFVADMKLAFDAMESSNHEHARGLLEAHRHQTNLLNFGWRYLWQETRSQEVHQFRGHVRRVRTLAFYPDGQSLASQSLDGVVKVCDLAARQERFTLTNVLALGGIAAAKTNLIIAKRDGSVSIIDRMSGREIESRRPES